MSLTGWDADKKLKLTVAADDINDPDDATTALTINNAGGGGAANTTYRTIINSSIITKSGSKIKITLGRSTQDWAFDAMWVGHKGSGAYDFDGNQVQVQFGGSNSATISADGTESDEITFDLDASKDLVVAFHNTSAYTAYGTTTGVSSGYKVATDDASTTIASGYTANTNGFGVKQITVTAIPALTDFPVLINLGTSVGKGSFDASAVFDELPTTIITAKSVVIDVADGHGGDYVSFRSIEFLLNGELISVAEADITCYASSEYSNDYRGELAFDTSLSQIGTHVGTTWMTASGETTSERLIVVFDTEQTFDQIVINNFHQSGALTNIGSKTVKIQSSTDSITSTTYDDTVTNATTLYEGDVAEHVATNTVDDEAVYQPQNKKIAIEVGDTGNQCYCEIERWDGANETAQLWVKVPSISASADTILNLYYDSTQDDNDDYIGDTGETPPALFTGDVATVSGGSGSYTYRAVIPASELLTDSSGKPVIKFLYLSASWTVNKAYIFKQAASGDDYDGEAGSGVQITMGGSTSFSVTSTDRYSDPIDFEIDGTDAVVVSIAVLAALPYAETTPTNCGLFYQSGDSAATENVSSYTDGSGSYWMIVEEIIGQPPAQRVWDDDFVAVYHMAQDPSGGTDCMLDSTSNDLHGTPVGTMTSGDLVDGAVGKAIDFDGTDDGINSIPHDADFDIDTFTLEAIVEPQAAGSHAVFHHGDVNVTANSGVVIRQTANKMDLMYNDAGGATWYYPTSVESIPSTGNPYLAWAINGMTAMIPYIDGVAGTSVSLSGTFENNSYSAAIGARRAGTGLDTFYAGELAEIRYSKIVRSADWITATNLSLTDALITFALPSSGSTVVISLLEQPYAMTALLQKILEQPYTLAANAIIKLLVQEYSLTDKMVQTLVQIYGLKTVAMLVQRYGDTPVLTKVLEQWYGDASQLCSLLEQPYADAYRVRATLDQPYVLPEVLLQILNQRYSIGGVLLRQVCDQQYNLMNVDLVRSHLVQPFNLLTDTTSVITPDPGDGVVITPQPIPPGSGSGGGGTPSPVVMGYTHINIEGGSDQYCLSCEVHLASQAHYNQISILDDLTISLLGQDYEFFVESKQRRRGFGTAEYAIVGLSKTALMDEPYADTITADDGDEYVGMASAIVTALAAPTTVHWNTVDWYIPANTLIPSDETPLSIIKNIAAAAGAIVQTEPNGDITIEPYWPIPIPDWTSTTPDYVLSDSLDFFTTGEDYLHKPGYNRYLVGDDEANNSSINFEEETLSTTTKNVRAYQVPWTGIFDINHTGCSWVLLEDQGVETRTIEDEVVEFIDGVGSTQYPIYSIVSYEWQCDELGTLEYEEDGSLISTVENESLLKISYQTKCQLYLVTDPESEQVQVVAEDI